MARMALLIISSLLGAATPHDQNLCRKYEGAYISYYEHIFLVKGCKRYAVTAQQEIYNLTRRGVVFQQVDAAVIRGMPLAGKRGSESRMKRKAQQQLCRSLQGKYITHSFVDIYYVDNCSKRLFPNWEAYQEHRRQHGAKRDDAITTVSWQEFTAIKTGKDMPHVPREAMPTLSDVDVIPIDQACEGLEGKYVSYYSKVYRIKNCHRQLIPAATVRKGGLQIERELTSEQWLSLPEQVSSK